MESFYADHPHPLFDVDKDRVIVTANPAATAAFGSDIIGKTCCEILFNEPAFCRHHCTEHAHKDGYCSLPMVRLRHQKNALPDEEHHLSLFPYRTTGGCHFAVHPLPTPFGRIREVRAITNRIVASKTPNEVIEHFRDFLTRNHGRPAYRVREYTPDQYFSPNSLKCTWHDTNVEVDRPYISSLRGSILTNLSPQGALSFYSVKHNCVTLVLRARPEAESFIHDFHAQEISEGLYTSQSKGFLGLTLLAPPLSNPTAAVFQNEHGDHCFLDVPFGSATHIVRKLSITPQRKRTHFTREEVEEIFTLHAVANTQIENILARERDKKIAKLDAIHEVQQPAFLALSAIEWLRKKDRENHRGPDFDKEAYYAKKNLEVAIRLVAFLNDSPLIAQSNPAASHFPQPIGLLGDVVAPIVNMVRHEEYMLERQRKRRGLSLRAEYLDDLQFPANDDENEYQSVNWAFHSSYSVSYSSRLKKVGLYVHQYRLQQVFYNLFSNASKFRRLDSPFELSVRLWRDSETPQSAKRIWKRFFVIDVQDNGVGIPLGEEEEIFKLGVRGSASLGIRGTGRGLFVVRETMLSIGGDVLVARRSNPTIFRLLFPVMCAEINWHEDRIMNLSRELVAEFRDSITTAAVDES